MALGSKMKNPAINTYNTGKKQQNGIKRNFSPPIIFLR